VPTPAPVQAVRVEDIGRAPRKARESAVTEELS
jgi:hypothetical protein